MIASEVLLIRHGQSEANAGVSDLVDSNLTALGVEQAQQAARELAQIDLRGFLALVSPYRRAMQTADAIAHRTGLTFAINEHIREWGKTATLAEQTYPEEPIDAVVTRLRQFLQAHQGQKLLIVSHATPVSLLMDLMGGRTPTTAGRFWDWVPNAVVLRAACGGTAANGDPSFRSEAGHRGIR